MQLYALLLRLYPRQFRQEFAAEMHTVFGDALASARPDGLWAMLRLWGREARELPRALAREHWQSVNEKEAGMDKGMRIMAGKGGASPAFREMPSRSWGEIFLAILPFLLLLLGTVFPMLLVESGLITGNTASMRFVSNSLFVFMLGVILMVFILAWRRKWPIWSATWSSIFMLTPLILVSGLFALLFKEGLNLADNQGVVIYGGFPLALAVLLYILARRDPLRGLLATLPVIYVLWVPNMEFVPDSIEVAIGIPSIALFCLTIVFLLRRGNWRTGIMAILATNLVVGVLFSYAGIYHGGSLPSTALRPNWVEVARSLITQYLAMGAILVGPLFARKFRQSGRSGGQTGRVGYHLALAGLLIVILATLATLMVLPPSGRLDPYSTGVQAAGIILGLGFYLLGLFLLFWDNPFLQTTSDWVMRLMLTVLPLVIPITLMLPFITWKWPISNLYGIPLLWVLPHSLSLSIGLAWLGLSVWVVTHGEQAASPTASLGVASEATPLR